MSYLPMCRRVVKSDISAMRNSMRSDRPREWSKKPAPSASRQMPLGDDRFKELVSRASAFFATAERDVVAEKAAMIDEIKGMMAEYQITLKMLQAE